MDTFSHGLWAGALAKGLNHVRARGGTKGSPTSNATGKREGKRKISVWATALWGVFPDLLAFTIPFTWIMWGLVFGGLDFSQFAGHRPPLAEPAGSAQAYIFSLTSVLYNMGHSLIIFAGVFFAVWALFRRAPLELLGWLLHILMDIPTHSYAFYPTPVFWPLLDWKFDGFSWGKPWFMILNYSLLLLVYSLLIMKKKR